MVLPKGGPGRGPRGWKVGTARICSLRVVQSSHVSYFGYEQHFAEVAEMERRDREIRFRVLDAAVAIEHEFISIAVFYLGGGSEIKQEVVERRIGDWGGMKAATGVIKTALALHRKADATTDTWFGQVGALMDLRHRLAHGTTESWRANPPEVRNGRIGREVRTRTRSGQQTLQWIDFEEAEQTVIAGRNAATSLSRMLADLTRRIGQ